MTIWTTPRLQPETMRLSEFGASRGESIGAAAETMFAGAPTFQPSRIRELQEAEGERDDLGGMIERIQRGDDLGEVVYGSQPERPHTPIAEARERVKAEGLTLNLGERDTIPSRALDIMIERARERRQREQVIARGPQDWTQDALNAGTSFLVGALDPLNVASAFIPVVGELRYAKLLADAGMSIPRRALIASAHGAASGAVGVAALQPMEVYANTQEGQDWHFTHSLQNIAFGAGLGAMLMGAGRYIGDVRRMRGDRPLYPFDVGELLDDHPAWADLRKPVEFKPLASEAFPGERAPVNLPEQFPDFPPEVRERLGLAETDPVPTPEAATILDLPPRAQEDAMRVAVAALVNGEPVRAGEMLVAAAEVDPRVAESMDIGREMLRMDTTITVNGETRTVSAEWNPAQAWRDLSRDAPEHSSPEVVAAAEAVAKMEPPPSTVESEPQGSPLVRKSAPVQGESTPEKPGDAAPAPMSEAAKAALEADARMAELYEAEVAGGYLPEENKKLNAALERIDQENAARAAVIQQGAACLLAGFAAGAA